MAIHTTECSTEITMAHRIFSIYIYIYIYIYFSFPLGGGFMESRAHPSRPNFPCLLRILYEASTVDTECAPSMWPLVTPLAWEEP